MPPKSLLSVVEREGPPPFVVRHKDDDWGTTVHAHQQRVMNQPFLAMPPPPNVPEARAGLLQDLVNASSAPLSVTGKMQNIISPQGLFDGTDVRSFIRIRPIVDGVDKALSVGDQAPVQKVAGKRDAIVFLPKLNATGTMLDAFSVQSDGTFQGTKEDNDFVYEQMAPQLLQYAVAGGATGVLCYGQTGSGKTHTAFGFLRNFAKDLEPHMEQYRLQLNVLELQQSSIVDVLSGETVQIIEGDQGVIYSGAEEPEMLHAEMLTKLIDAVASQRIKHQKSSAKTHLIARILIRNKRTAWAKPGSIIIVDCAGSEKAADADMRHIGASFTALKDCIRIRAIQKANQTANEGSVPIRTTNFTFVLRDLLEVATRATKLAMIFCVAPGFINLRPTVETLRMATLCCVQPATVDVTQPPMIGQFTFQDCCDFLAKVSFGRVRSAASILPEGFDGRKMLSMNEEQFIAMLSDGPQAALRVPVRIAKSCFSTMQSIAIVTRSLGPSAKAPVMGFGGPKRQMKYTASTDTSTPTQVPLQPADSSKSLSASARAISPVADRAPPPLPSSGRSAKPPSTPRQSSSTSAVVPLPSIMQQRKDDARTVPPARTPSS